MILALRLRPSLSLAAASLLVAAGLLLAARPSFSCDQDKSATAANQAGSSSCSRSCASICGAHGAKGATASATHSAACAAACKAAAKSTRTSATAASAHRARRAHHATAVRRVTPATAASAPAPGAPIAVPASSAPGAGIIAVIDPRTGLLTQPTPEQLREFAAARTQAAPNGALSARPDPPIYVMGDGTKMVLVGDRLTQYASIQRDASGRLHYDCGPKTGVEPTAAPASDAAAPSLQSPAPAEEK